MTVQHQWELMRKVDPGLGETEAIVLLNAAQNQFATETLILEATVNLTLTTALSYTLPTDCISIHKVIPKESSGTVLENISYSIDHGYITFVDNDNSDATTMPSNVATITLLYYQLPTALTALTGTSTLPSQFHMAMVWYGMGVLSASDPGKSIAYMKLFETLVFKGKQYETDRVSNALLDADALFIN
jgi:hypothetical protein